MEILKKISQKLDQRTSYTQSPWFGLTVTVFFVAQLYVLMEWVFLATKPSFMNVFSLPDKLKILLIGGALAAGVSVLGLGIFHLIGWVVRLRHYPKAFVWLACLLPAVILATLLLMMVDNFTYTVFSFGIATTRGAGRSLYVLLLLVLIGWSVWQVAGVTESIQRWLVSPAMRRGVWIGMVVWLVVGLVWGITSNKTSSAALALDASDRPPSSHPNIIWITGDGISASHVSLYGYERDTTPNLRTLAESSLVAENVFANAKNTLGSLISMFTGKPALDTRVMYSPDILVGEDAYQHLPGILRYYGYYSIQYGYQFYVDAYVVNVMDGFDIANGRSLTSSPWQTELRKYLPEGVVYFVFEAGNRIVDRLRHVTYIKAMQDPREALAAQVPAMNDDERQTAFFDGLDQYDQPVFIHLHYMGTHGALFSPKQQVFSAGRAPTMEGWDRDFFDDAILEFDWNVGQIVEELKQRGLWENTLLIVSSDHAAEFDQRQRIPLLIHFPGDENSARIIDNVQNLDIAPTILDYLGLAQPNWMSGQSLLDGNLGERYIYASGARTFLGEEMATGEWMIDPERLSPPFYQLSAISLVDCQRWYELNLANMSLTSGDAVGHTAPCAEDELLTFEQVYGLLLTFMQENKYDISSLENVPLESLLDGE